MYILNAILTKITILIVSIINMFPDTSVTLATNLLLYESNLATKIGIVNFLFPVTMFLYVLGIIVGIEIQLFMLKVAMTFFKVTTKRG